MSEQNYQVPPPSPASKRVSGSDDDSMLLSGSMQDKVQEITGQRQSDSPLLQKEWSSMYEGNKNAELLKETIKSETRLSPLKKETVDSLGNATPWGQIGGRQPLVKIQTFQSKPIQTNYNSKSQLSSILEQRKQTLYKAFRNTFSGAESPVNSPKIDKAHELQEHMPQQSTFIAEQTLQNCNGQQELVQHLPNSAANNTVPLLLESVDPESLSMIVNTSCDRRTSLNDINSVNKDSIEQIKAQKEDDTKTVYNAPEPMDIETHVQIVVSQKEEKEVKNCETNVQTLLVPSGVELKENHHEEEPSNFAPEVTEVEDTRPEYLEEVIDQLESNETIRKVVEPPQEHQPQNTVSAPPVEEPLQSFQMNVVSSCLNINPEQNIAVQLPGSPQRENSSKVQNIPISEEVPINVENEIANNERNLKAEYAQQQEEPQEGQHAKDPSYSGQKLQHIYSQSPNYVPYEKEKSIRQSSMIVLEHESPQKFDQVQIEEKLSSRKILQRSPKREVPSLSNIFVHNSYHPEDKPMATLESLNEMNQRMPVSQHPPCITININRHNEISLSIFNNNIHHGPADKGNKDMVIKEQIVNQEEPGLQDISTELCDARNEASNHKIMKNQLIEKEKKDRTIEISSCTEEHPSVDTPIFNLNTENQEVQTSQIVNLQSSDELSKESIKQTFDRVYNAADAYLSISKYEPCDHKNFEEIIKPHVAQRISTYPVTEIGEMLFKDGLFLTALARFLTQSSGTPFLANYVYEYLHSAFRIERNQFIFQQAFEQATMNFERHLEERYMQKYSKIRQEIEQVQLKQRPVRRTLQDIDSAESIEVKKEGKFDNLRLSSNFFSLNEQVSKPSEKGPVHIQQKSPVMPMPVIEEKQSDKLASINTSAQSSEVHELRQNKSADDNHEKIGQYHKKDKLSKDKHAERESTANDKAYKFDVAAHKESSKAKEPKESVKKEHDSKSKCAEKDQSSSDRAPRDSRFRELYEKYLNHRKSTESAEANPTSQEKGQPLSGILKSKGRSGEERSSVDTEGKKRKNVQFVEVPVVQHKEESEEQLPSRPKKGGKKMKVRDDSLQDEVPKKKSHHSRKHRK